MRASALPALIVACVGCQFGAPGGSSVSVGLGKNDTGATDDADDGSSDADDGDDQDSVSPGDNTGDGPAMTSMSSTSPGDDTDGSDDATTAVVGGGGVLAIAEAPSFDLGNVAVPGSTEHAFMLTNIGDEPAVGIMAGTLPGPFAFGASGTCVGMLAPGESCTMAVVFSPVSLGFYGTDLVVEYDGGAGPASVTVAITAGGAGSSPNLLANPGGETTGSPPPSWTEGQGSDWQTTTATVHMGAYSIFAGDSSGGTHSLNQVLDVSEYATSIDAGVLRVDGSAYIRAGSYNNNPGRVRLGYRDVNGTEIGSSESSNQPSTTWQQRTSSATLPVGTRSVQYRLVCTKPTWETTCDAYFDTASLVVSYP